MGLGRADYLVRFRDRIQRRKWCVGLYAGIDYNSPYLIVNSVVSYPPPPPPTKGKEWSREDLSYWLSTFVFSANFQNNKYEKGVGGREGGKG
jgi:hypothetical protein